MDIDRIHDILNKTTIQLRKSESVVERDGAVEIYAMPPADSASGVAKIDMEFITVGVDIEAAIAAKDDLISILSAWPNKGELDGGPSYIAVGATIGSQAAALQLFALGAALKLWNVITPSTFGFQGEEARQMAGMGLLMIDGYRHGDALIVEEGQ